jgi:hypothetical protein
LPLLFRGVHIIFRASRGWASREKVMMQRTTDQMRLKTGGFPLAASARALTLKLLLRRP